MRAVAALFVFSLIPAMLSGGRHSTESFHGDVVLRSSGERQMVVLLDSCGCGDRQDGRADHVWVIASETPYSAAVPIFLRDALVISEARRVTVYSAAGDAVIVFRLDGVPDEMTCAAGTVQRFAGYGLSQYRGAPDLPRMKSDAHDPDPWGDPETGPGSNSQAVTQ
jgi:hypothetical protein